MANEMRDRLKENISIIKRHNDTGIPVINLTNRNKFEVQVIDEIVEAVSLIIEKMENKILIELPCKIGDKVYEVICYKNCVIIASGADMRKGGVQDEQTTRNPS